MPTLTMENEMEFTEEFISSMNRLAAVADRILAEAPHDTAYINVMLDCEGNCIRMELSDLRMLTHFRDEAIDERA